VRATTIRVTACLAFGAYATWAFAAPFFGTLADPYGDQIPSSPPNCCDIVSITASGDTAGSATFSLRFGSGYAAGLVRGQWVVDINNDNAYDNGDIVMQGGDPAGAVAWRNVGGTLVVITTPTVNFQTDGFDFVVSSALLGISGNFGVATAVQYALGPGTYTGILDLAPGPSQVSFFEIAAEAAEPPALALVGIALAPLGLYTSRAVSVARSSGRARRAIHRRAD
jgi:hypothetical protein